MTSPALISKHRLEALADGVYSIALTLLVLDLKLPPIQDLSESTLVQALLGLLPKALVWVLSFWVMAMFWLAQQRILRLYSSLDSRALRIELLQLGLISLLPFSTSLVGEHGSFVASAFVYAAHMSLLALLSLLRVQRLTGNPFLRSEEFDAALVRSQAFRSGVMLICALLSAALAFWKPGWNMFAMLPLLLVPVNRVSTTDLAHARTRSGG